MSSSSVSGRLGVLFEMAAAFVSDGGTTRTEVVKPPPQFAEVRILPGYGANQAEAVAIVRYAIAASGTQNVDFSGGFTDANGATIVPSKLRAVVYMNNGTTTITVKKAASNGLAGRFSGSTDSMSITKGGADSWYSPDGITVTAGTGDLETITNTSSSVAADVYVLALFTTT